MSTMDTRAFLNDIEGHLLVAATREEARTAAARFTAGLDWMTPCEREEVERLFEAEYLVLARASWRRTAVRGEELRGEYEETYRGLRRRLVACCLLGFSMVVAVALVALSVA